jgi:hypothetical protein
MGVGLGMVGGSGDAGVVARELRVYHGVGPAPWWRRLIETFLGV